MTKAAIIIQIENVAKYLRRKSLCPGLYDLPSKTDFKRATREQLLQMLRTLDASLTLREKLDRMEGVTFIDNYASIRMMSSKYPFYIGRNGILFENVGIGWTEKRKATDEDFTKHPVLI